MKTGHVRPWLGAVCLMMIGVFVAPAWAGEGSVGDCNPPNVVVRGKKTFKNRTGKTADDFHFYMYQNDRPGVVVNGARASSSSFGNVGVQLGTDNGRSDPPPGNHGAAVEMSGGSVPAGGSIEVEVELCMNERNNLKMKDIEWTFTGGGGGDGGPPRPARRNNGWRIERPFPGGRGGDPRHQEGNGGVGRWIHRVCIENDSDDPLPLRWVKLFASMTRYSDLDGVNWDAVPNIQDAQGRPPVTIPPWGRWCIDFETTGSYIAGHIYLKYAIEPVEGELLTEALVAADEEEDEEDISFGDHPVEEAMLDTCLAGLDLWQTTTSTQYVFGGDLPEIPADFFHPGSEPFVGTVSFCGNPIDPALYGNADTIVSRQAPAELPLPGSTDTVPVELTGLNLASCEPILVRRTETAGAALQDVLQGFTSSGSPFDPALVHVSTDPVLPGESEIEAVRLSVPAVVPPDIEVLLTGEDSGGPVGVWGIDSFFDVFYELPVFMEEFPSSTTFNVLVDIGSVFASGNLPMLDPPVVMMDGTGVFVVEWNVEVREGLQARHRLTFQAGQSFISILDVQAVAMLPGLSVLDLHVVLDSPMPWAVLPDTPVVSTTLVVEPVVWVDSFFDVFMELDPDYPSTGVMELTRNSENDGTFTSQITYTPRVSFMEAVLPTGQPGEATFGGLVLPGAGPIMVTGSSSWRHGPPPPAPLEGSGPNFWPLPGVPLALLTGAGSPHTLVQAQPLGSPTLVFADSRRAHGSAGVFDLDLLSPVGVAPVAVECRSNAPSTALLTFNKPVYAPGGLPGAASLAGGGTLSVLSLADYELIVDLADVPDGARSTLSFPGIVDGEGNAALDTLCFGRLTGDVTGDGAVNIFDLVQVRNRLNQSVGLASMRTDVTGDGAINIFDLVQVRNHLNQSLVGPCP
ncbi:MAG: hypothetical protein GXY55_07865 [Phycisphaerae bacterium]|nr:hypothetical protein [Phycisphaerae bacterium]